MKSRRQATILEIVEREEVTSQEQLRQRLRERGFEATQATLSRDIRDLGLVKRAADGAYRQVFCTRRAKQGKQRLYPVSDPTQCGPGGLRWL